MHLKKYLMNVIMLGFVIVACVGHKSFENSLSKAVLVAKEDTSNSIIAINKLTDFDWDYLCIFTPYTPQEDIVKFLGFEWKDASSTKIEMRDDINLVVFIKDNEVVRYFELARGIGDFSQVQSGKKFTKENAKFRVFKEPNYGSEWFFLKETDGQ